MVLPKNGGGISISKWLLRRDGRLHTGKTFKMAALVKFLSGDRVPVPAVRKQSL